jgi:2-dehydro-3-deoxygluconokinase
VLSFGEILLRLTAPGYTRLFQNNSLETSFCGAEANVAVSLAIFGIDSSFITKVPENDVGHAALNSMRYFGVDIKQAIYGQGRMGLYYLEKGASQRASKIIYDRAYSAFALAKREDFDWNTILDGYDWFHWTGINPALSENMAQICMDACKTARAKGIPVSCDLNYRGSLWSSELAQTVMKQLMPYVDVCIANEEDADRVLGIRSEDTDVDAGKICKHGYQSVASRICDAYGCKYAAITLRKSDSASDNDWSAVLYDAHSGQAYFSKEYKIHIVDRVGGGDSFSAGIIYGLITGMRASDAVEFAAAASCLKQTIEGDYSRVSVSEVMALVNGHGRGRVQR